MSGYNSHGMWCSNRNKLYFSVPQVHVLSQYDHHNRHLKSLKERLFLWNSTLDSPRHTHIFKNLNCKDVFTFLSPFNLECGGGIKEKIKICTEMHTSISHHDKMFYQFLTCDCSATHHPPSCRCHYSWGQVNLWSCYSMCLNFVVLTSVLGFCKSFHETADTIHAR
jgi:hypothetical protein